MAYPTTTILSTTLFLVCFHQSLAINSTTYNIFDLGANPNGQIDSTNSMSKAWSLACASIIPSTIYVPQGRFMLKHLHFKGPCTNKAITFLLDGTLVAPLYNDYGAIGNIPHWLLFERADGVSIRGGVLDARGAALWACKTNGSNNCTTGFTTLAISNSKNVRISGLTSVNSQMFHIVINGCENVMLQGARVLASGNSPNTDGIHVQLSRGVTILNSQIGTGDDCISIGPGAADLWIENVGCGPGHGISIGSLGKDYEEAGVQNVTVKSVTFQNTQNGLRIKTWGRPSKGFVKDVVFQHAIMSNVQNPILIDQNYCPSNINCPGQKSGVKISNVTYQDIQGTSATNVAVKFDCSETSPCHGIRLENVNLSYQNRSARATCFNAGGTTAGIVEPSSCLF
ncbi:Pectin lyase-like superfamily protein [Perilla frutescens var. frutescens]|nr:Pectin lyase-like superfamily protein [Perilla frutescens var. frutescens]